MKWCIPLKCLAGKARSYKRIAQFTVNAHHFGSGGLIVIAIGDESPQGGTRIRNRMANAAVATPQGHPPHLDKP
jgi:hypothetical protein